MCQAKSKGEVEPARHILGSRGHGGSPRAGRWLHLTDGGTGARRAMCLHSHSSEVAKRSGPKSSALRGPLSNPTVLCDRHVIPLVSSIRYLTLTLWSDRKLIGKRKNPLI